MLLTPQPADRLTATVDVTVAGDSVTRPYSYNYSVSNDSTRAQAIWFFAIRLAGDSVKIESSTSPEGWNFSVHTDRPMVSWAAVEGIEPDNEHPNDAAPSRGRRLCRLRAGSAGMATDRLARSVLARCLCMV